MRRIGYILKLHTGEVDAVCRLYLGRADDAVLKPEVTTLVSFALQHIVGIAREQSVAAQQVG